MFYKNKETKEIVYLVKSDNKRSIIFEYDDNGQTTSGRIIKKPKREFKKEYIKNKKCIFEKPEDKMVELVIEDYETNRYAYDNNFEDYIEEKKYLDRQEDIKRQTDADRVRLMKELADDYMPTKPKMERKE